MSEELKKFRSVPLYVQKPNYNITFHCDGKEIGQLDFNGPEMAFTGQAEESAVVFFDFIAELFDQRLKQERLAEREACAKVCEELKTESDAEFYGHEFAAAIRSRT